MHFIYKNQQGFAPLLLLIAGAILLLFITLLYFAPFKDSLLSSLSPKSPSHAASTDLFPLGLFEDGTITNTPTAMQNLITFARNNNLDSVLFTNNKVSTQMPMLDTSDQQNFNVFFAPMTELSSEWFNSTIEPTLANAQTIITPLINQMKTHPSIKGYNLRDDVTMLQAEKLGLALEVFKSQDPARPASAVYLEDPHAKVIDLNNPGSVFTYYYPAKASKAACDWGFTSDTVNAFSQAYRQVNRYKVNDTDPTYAILQTHKTTFGPASTLLRVPTLEEISLQNWMALGEGSKGIFWFIYSSEQGWVGIKDDPAITARISQLSSRTRLLTPLFMNLQKAEDYFHLSGSGNRYISTLQDNTTGKYYVLIANGSCSAPQDLSVTSTIFSGSLKDIESNQTASLNTPINVGAGDTRIFEVINLTGSIPSPTPAPNLFTNSSFETLSSGSPSSWGGAKVGSSADTTTAHTGSNSLKITGAAGSYTSQSPSQLKPGTMYTIKYWVKSSVPLTGKGVGFRVYSGVSGTTPFEIIYATGANPNWTQISETFFTPINYSPGGRLDLIWDLKAGETAWVDDVFICEGKECLPKLIIIQSPSSSPFATPSPIPSPSPKPGDIDGNNKVDIFDYNLLLTNFGRTGTNLPGDFDNNGRVDIFDFNVLLTNFGH